MNEKAEQIKKVLSDEAFVKACLEAENEEAVQKLFADKGIEMSVTEIELTGELLKGVQEGSITEEQLEKLANGGELSEEELSEAAGGGLGQTLYDFFHKQDAIVERVVDSIGVGYKHSIPITVLDKGKVAGVVAAGVVVVGTAALGICKLCGVDIKKAVTRW